MERNLECLERIIDKLTDRNEELQQEKEALIVENHNLQKDIDEQAKQLSSMRCA